ncbi:MAG TPA: hypothetical protein VLV31_04325 [Candidatus Acidoferrales bacterium]|nr:hypothetical protein [Candidatus Acidoferrales bacterium]
MNHPQSVLFGVMTVRFDVKAMPGLGLVLLALIIRAALGIVVVVALVWLALKLGRLADAYTKKLQAS